MTHTLIPYALVWAVLAIIVIAMAVYRRSLANQEDDTLHIRDDEVQMVAQQGVLAHKLEVIDRWGKILTGVAALAGVVIGGLYVYWSWLELNASSSNLQIIR